MYLISSPSNGSIHRNKFMKMNMNIMNSNISFVFLVYKFKIKLIKDQPSSNEGSQ